MFRQIIKFILVSFLLVSTSFAQEDQAPSSESNDVVVSKTVASIDGEPITTADMTTYGFSTGEIAPKEIKSGDPQSRRLLQDLVAQKLIAKEAERIGVEVDEGEVDRYIEEIQRQNNVDQAAFEELLKSQGLSVDEYKQQVQNDILRTRVLAAEVRSKINITEEDIERYLDDRPELKPEEGDVRVRQILIRLNGGETKEVKHRTEAEILEIRTKLYGGDDWETVGGEYYSDLGYVNPSDLREELKAALQSVEDGEVSEVIKTDTGYYLVSVTRSDGKSGVVDEEIREGIRQKITEQKFEEALKRYLDKELPERYHVQLQL